MNEMVLFKIVEVMFMIIVLFYVRKIVPKLEEDTWRNVFAEFQDWALIAVRWAQDRMKEETGENRRKAAINALIGIRKQLGLEGVINDEQIFMLVSDAYTIMKAEGIQHDDEPVFIDNQTDGNS